MNFKVLLRCSFISLSFCAPAPLLIALLISFIGGELSRELFVGLVEVNGIVTLYLTTALAVFVVLFFATLTLNLLTPKLVNLAEVESDDREIGEVKWFNVNKGYGFITGDNGEDVFVHFRAIRGRGHRTLAEGQKVRYYVTENERGLQADDVTVIT